MRNKIITAFFCLLLAVAALAGLIMPDRYYSEREKRTLTQKPQFTIADFISGRFSDNLESYLTDQDPLRDGWVTMKTYLDLAVGKKESGGVYICKDKYLMDKFISYSKKQLAANAASLADLQEKLAAEGISMQTILVPMAAQVLTDKLPAYAPVADYAAILQVLTDSGVDTTDVFSVLAAHSSENIYYRTDHHWTARGAYEAYIAFCKSSGLPPVSLEEMEHQQIDGFLGTFYSQTHDSQLAQTPDFVEYFVPPVQTTTTRYQTGAPFTPIDSSIFASYATGGQNTYSVFLHGDFPLTHIQTDNRTGRKILLVKESYGNAFAPFLACNFDEVYIVDQRYFELGLVDFVKEHGITDLLFLNNIFAVNTDVRIRELSRIQNQSYQPISQQPVQQPTQQTQEIEKEAEEQREEMSNQSKEQAEKQENETPSKPSKTEDPPRRLGHRE